MTFSSAKDLPLLRGLTLVPAPKNRERRALMEGPDLEASGGVRTARKARKAGTTGKTLEKLVLASPGVVLTQHRQEAKRIGGGKLIAQRGPCDFSGTLPGGRHITFDAKEADPVRRLDTHEHHLPRHQVDHLVRHGRGGAVSGVLALSRARGRIYWLDWRLLEPRRASYQWDDLYDVGPISQAVHWPLVLRAAAYVEASVLRPDTRP